MEVKHVCCSRRHAGRDPPACRKPQAFGTSRQTHLDFDLKSSLGWSAEACLIFSAALS